MEAVVEEGGEFDFYGEPEWMAAPEEVIGERGGFLETFQCDGAEIAGWNEEVGCEFERGLRYGRDAADGTAFERVSGLDGARSVGFAGGATIYAFSLVNLRDSWGLEARRCVDLSDFETDGWLVVEEDVEVVEACP